MTEPKTLRIIVVGDSTVGKTAVILKFVDNVSVGQTSPTIGVDFKTKDIKVRGQDIKFQVWDTAGQERFRTLAVSYFRKAQGIALFYDVTSRDSFKHLNNWIDSIYGHVDADVPIVIFGNKVDLQDRRVVSIEEATELTNQFEVPYFETSARTGEGVNEAFMQIAEKIIDRQSRQEAVTELKEPQGVQIDKETSSKKKKKCCK